MVQMKKRQYTAKMTPWDRRTESHEARQKRHEAQIEEELKEMEEKRKEKENGVEQFLISGKTQNWKTIRAPSQQGGEVNVFNFL